MLKVVSRLKSNCKESFLFNSCGSVGRALSFESSGSWFDWRLPTRWLPHEYFYSISGNWKMKKKFKFFFKAVFFFQTGFAANIQYWDIKNFHPRLRASSWLSIWGENFSKTHRVEKVKINHKFHASIFYP